MEASVPWKGGRTVHLVLLFMNSDIEDFSLPGVPAFQLAALSNGLYAQTSSALCPALGRAGWS